MEEIDHVKRQEESPLLSVPYEILRLLPQNVVEKIIEFHDCSGDRMRYETADQGDMEIIKLYNDLVKTIRAYAFDMPKA